MFSVSTVVESLDTLTFFNFNTLQQSVFLIEKVQLNLFKSQKHLIIQ